MDNLIYHKIYKHQTSSEWIVLIHGVGGSSSIWFKQVREFIRHFNVLMVDLRGHGKSRDFFSQNKSLNYSFSDVSKDVLEVMNHVGIEKAHFMGVSLGTILIRTIAEIDVSKMKSMILCGAVTRLNVRSRFLMQFATLVRKYVPFMWLYTLFAYILMPRNRNKEARNMFVKDAKLVRHSEYMRWFKLTAEVNPILRYFTEKEVPVPTLYVMGDEDYMFLPQVKNLVKIHQYSQLVVLENCGHVCNVEQPALFNKHSIDFIHTQS